MPVAEAPPRESRAIYYRPLKRQAAEKAVEAAIKIFEWDIQSKQKRVQMYADMHERLWRIVKERAADPAMAKVPGGQSGIPP